MKGISSRSLIDGGGGGQSLEGLDAQYTGTNGVTGCLPVTVGARPDALRPVLRTVGLTQAVSEPSAPEKAATSAGTGLQRLHRKQGSVRSMTHIRYAQCTWKGAPYADTVDTEHNLKLALPYLQVRTVDPRYKGLSRARRFIWMKACPLQRGPTVMWSMIRRSMRG